MESLINQVFPQTSVNGTPAKCGKCKQDLPLGKRAYLCNECAEKEKLAGEKKRIAAIVEKREEAVSSWWPPTRYMNSTFETFNQKLQPKAYKLTSSLNTNLESKGLLLIGPPGVGKTHLAAAVFNKFYELWKPETEHYPDARFLRENDLFKRLRASFRPGAEETEEQILEDFTWHAGILILDDLCKYETGDSKFRNRIYFEFIDSVYNNESALMVITANNTLPELTAMLGTPIMDRLRDMCQLCEMTGKSYRGGDNGRAKDL